MIPDFIRYQFGRFVITSFASNDKISCSVLVSRAHFSYSGIASRFARKGFEFLGLICSVEEFVGVLAIRISPYLRASNTGKVVQLTDKGSEQR